MNRLGIGGLALTDTDHRSSRLSGCGPAPWNFRRWGVWKPTDEILDDVREWWFSATII